MKLGYEDGRVTCHDLDAHPVVLENVGGLTEKAVSEIVRDHNIGTYVRKCFEDDNVWAMNIWQITGLLGDILRFVAQERRDHWSRCKETTL